MYQYHLLFIYLLCVNSYFIFDMLNVFWAFIYNQTERTYVYVSYIGLSVSEFLQILTKFFRILDDTC